MQIKNNTEVVDARGKSLGSVDRVVIDPATREVTHLVTKKGILFTREKVISLDQVDRDDADRIVLKKDVDPDRLPDFEEEYHIPMDAPGADQEQARQMIWYPGIEASAAGAAIYPYGQPAFYVRTRRNIPQGALVLEEGADVVCRDGDKAGKVERLFTAREDRVTHIVIREGLIARERKLIPSAWIDRVHDGTVELRVTCDIVDGLPAFAE